MKLDPGIHIVMHSVLFLKPGVTESLQSEFFVYMSDTGTGVAHGLSPS